MSVWSALVGGAAGWMVGGPLGALVGSAMGHAVERVATTVADGGAETARDQTKSIAFTIGVIALGAKMAKADGVVLPSEVVAFHQVFRVPPHEHRNVTRVFDAARRDARGFEPYARQIGGMFRDRPAVLEDLLHCLFHIAKADGVVADSELRYLHAVADLFGFSDEGFNRIRAAEIGPDQADPHAVLGVPVDADAVTIKAAYRRLMREHHPDRLIADGLPQEFIDIATEKVAAINAAYDRIKQMRPEVGNSA